MVLGISSCPLFDETGKALFPFRQLKHQSPTLPELVRQLQRGEVLVGLFLEGLGSINSPGTVAAIVDPSTEVREFREFSRSRSFSAMGFYGLPAEEAEKICGKAMRPFPTEERNVPPASIQVAHVDPEGIERALLDIAKNVGQGGRASQVDFLAAVVKWRTKNNVPADLVSEIYVKLLQSGMLSIK